MREKNQERRMMRLARAVLALALLAPAAARASFLSGEALDTAANVLSWVVLVVVPIVAIGLFGYVHVLPELIAEKRQHPQKHAIKTLCILSLFFGGLLWPFAWLWAYTKPIGYRAIYGTERHEDYYLEMGEKARSGKLDPAEVDHLREELAMMASKVTLSPALKQLAAELDAISAARKAAAPAPVPRGAE
jgi:CBS domain containing-hemolysin-like protein